MNSRTVLACLMMAATIVACAPEVYEVDEPAGEEIVESDWEPMRTVEGRELSDDEIDALLARLPELEERDGDEVEFKRRDESMPPPLTGDDIDGQWPPDLSRPTAETAADGPLRAQAFRPEGQVDPPFQVAIAFDRPVVDVGAVGTQSIPDELELTPEIDGRWRWLGTQTIVFEPTDRWPMATEFSVQLDDGLQATDGSALDERLAFEFATPAPEVQSIAPNDRGFLRAHGADSYPTDTPVAVVFNQAIDQQSVDAIRVENDGQPVSMTQLDGDERREVMEQLGLRRIDDDRRVIALRPDTDYAKASTVEVGVQGPIRSAEGPVMGDANASQTFETYEELQFEHSNCPAQDECRPGQTVNLQFNNPLDVEPEQLDVSVEPAVDDLDVRVRGSRLIVGGDFRARSEYSITIPADVRDEFGQQLGAAQSTTVHFGSHRPFIAGPDQSMVIRPSTMSPAVPVMSAEVETFRVRVYDVDLSEGGDWRVDVDEAEPVDETTVSVSPEQLHQPTQHFLDFSAALDGNGFGQAVVYIDNPRPWDHDRFSRRDPTWQFAVQRTDLAVDVTTDGRQIAVDVTQISDGQPVDGADVSIGGEVQGSTDADGEVIFDAPASGTTQGPMVVSRGGDEVVIPRNNRNYHSRSSGWDRQSPSTSHRYFVVDDRQMYKPGETVRIRGWVRTLEDTPRSIPESVDDDFDLHYKVYEPRRNEIDEGQLEVDAYGGFELEFDVPDDANLGTARIQFSPWASQRRQTTTHTVQFQEFRRPEYEVTVDSDAGPHTAGESTAFRGQASYYAGGDVSGASTEWSFDESLASYRPAGWQGWSFGEYRTWWFSRSRSGGDSDHQVLPAEFRESVAGETDADGRDDIEMIFESPERGFARRVSSTLSVQDVDRQAWEATDSVVVHPSSVYVGLRSETNFISREESFEVEAVAVDVDGEPVEGRPVELAIRPRGNDDAEPVATCEVVSEEEPVDCSFSGLTPGSYQVVAHVEDEAGRRSETEFVFWVSGRDQRGAETAEEDELVLVPGAAEFSVGDTAQLLVQAPYYPLEAVVELRRDGRYDRRRVTLTEDDPVVDIDIEETMIPNVHVQVVGLGVGDGYGYDHFASGSLELNIDRGPRTLGVEIEPEGDIVEPGQDVDIDLQVTDDGGEPVGGAQVLLFGVDESVLALSDYQLADPLSAFFPGRSSGVSDLRSRNWMLLDDSDELDELSDGETLDAADSSRGGGDGYGRVGGLGSVDAEAESSVGMARLSGADDTGTESDAIELREVFDALAVYRSDLVTDADGRVEVTETIPDSLTRYRLMAVAVGDDNITFGSGETDITARKPLMVSPSAPRFVNVGDAFDLSVVIHNQSDKDRSVDVALRATAGLSWIENPGRNIEVAAGQRRELRFAAHALSAGDTRIQIAASDDDYHDAELVRLPVMTPATTEAFASYGTIDTDDDDAVLEGLRVPEDAYPQYGGLEVSTSSTQLQALTDAFIHLTTYRFRAAPQLASRILSVLSLYDVLDAFDADDLPEPDELEASLEQWVDELIELQQGDGGFGYWSSSRESSPYISVHAANALVKAESRGIEFPEHLLRRALQYLSQIDRHLDDYGNRAAGAVSAYALNVLDKSGRDVSSAQIDAVISRYGVDGLSVEALGWLLPLAERGTVGEAEVLQRITNQVQETAATAEFQETYDRGAHRILHTTRRTDGVVLDGLMQVDADHPLVDKVVRGLLGNRQRGRWSNTQENVFIIMALRRYFDAHEDAEPDFIARAWLGDRQIAEHEFRGRSTDRHHVDVPMRFLMGGEDRLPVVFQRDGVGRMYYRMGVNYAPQSRELPPENQGFSVERTYEAVDDDGDVRRTDEGWEISAGARVRVELSMTIPARRNHVALVDWLPAGFEPLNPALSVTNVDGDLTGSSSDRGRWGWWGWPWYEHQNMRDERVEAFASQVSEGVHTYSYVARATTPGQFVAMPAKAEEMYHPETFGRSASETVTVVDD